MLARDNRTPCRSCERRDDKLRDCPKCGKQICTFCWPLHVNYDHKDDDDKRIKLIDFKPGE